MVAVVAAGAIPAVADEAAPTGVPDLAFAADGVLAPLPKCQLTWPLPGLLTPLSWVDHHYPTRQMDGVMIRFDGATDVFYDGHRGLDLPVVQGTPVRAAADGVVVYAGWTDSGGWGVSVAHDGCRTLYFHNSALLAAVGEHVVRGQVISLSGTTGNSTGPHLHFEVRDLYPHPHAIDPYGWTGPGTDPWPWDEGVLWRGGRPEVVPEVPAAAPLSRPPSDLDLALREGSGGDAVAQGPLAGAAVTGAGELRLAGVAAVALPVQGPALRLRSCGTEACVLDLRGDVFVVSGGWARLVFTLPMDARAADMACLPAACVVLDSGGELYAVAVDPGVQPPDLSALPGAWPLPAAPRGIELDQASTARFPVGRLLDRDGNAYSFGLALFPEAGRGSAVLDGG